MGLWSKIAIMILSCTGTKSNQIGSFIIEWLSVNNLKIGKTQTFSIIYVVDLTSRCQRKDELFRECKILFIVWLLWPDFFKKVESLKCLVIE